MKHSKGSVGFPPPRPAVNPMFLCGLSTWVSCACSFTLARMLEIDVLTGVLCFSAAMLVVLVAGFRKGRAVVVYLCAGISIGAMMACAQAISLHIPAQPEEATGSFSCKAICSSDMTDSAYGCRCNATVLEGPSAGRTVQLSFPPDVSRVYFGDRLNLNVTAETLDFAEDDFAWRQGTVARFEVASFEVYEACTPIDAVVGLRKRAISHFGSFSAGAGPLYQAFICGYRSGFSESDLYAAFKRCGLAHLAAVSGAHLSIVVFIFDALLRACHVHRKVRVLVLAVVLGAYLVLAAAPLSSLRAAVMAFVSSTALFSRRRSSSLGSLGVCMVVMVVMQPLCSVSLGFCLSVLSCAGIILFSPLFTYLFNRIAPKMPASLKEPSCLTLSASLLGLPISCAQFSQLPLVSILANTVAAPFFAPICMIGLIDGTMGAVIGGSVPVLDELCFLLAACLSQTVTAIASIPFACIPVSLGMEHAGIIAFCLAAALWFAWPTRFSFRAFPALCIAGLLCVVLACLFGQQEDEIVMLDVGQGDAFLVRSEGASLLIDTGNHDAELLEALGRERQLALDGVLITHADDDHFGSLDALAVSSSVGAVFVADGMDEVDSESSEELMRAASTASARTVEVKAGDSFRVGAFEAQVIWPYALNDSGKNQDSVCVVLDYDGDDDGTVDFRALFTGDIDSASLKEALERSGIGRIDILKASHHGSDTGLDDALAEHLHPSIALIGVGQGNRYGHPHREVLEMLEERQCQIYRSDLCGDVSCRMEGDRMIIATER